MAGFAWWLLHQPPFDAVLGAGVAALIACAWWAFPSAGWVAAAWARGVPAACRRRLGLREHRAHMSSRDIRRADWDRFCAELDLLEIVLISERRRQG
jgi:hypothetical protein